MPASAAAVSLDELVEDQFLGLPRNPDARVFDRDPNHAPGRLRDDLDVPPVGELHRI